MFFLPSLLQRSGRCFLQEWWGCSRPCASTDHLEQEAENDPQRRSQLARILNGDPPASLTRRRAQTWCSLFVAPCAPEGTPPVLAPPAALLDSLFEQRIAHNSEQSVELETRARSPIAIGEPSGFSGNWVSDTFFFHFFNPCR